MPEKAYGSEQDGLGPRGPEGTAPGSAPDSGSASAPGGSPEYDPYFHGTHGGRRGSWVAVAIMVAGFTVGGVALCIGPSWVTFWAGAAIIVVGFVVGGAVRIFSDVVVDAPRVIPEIVDYSVFGRRTARRRGGEAGETLDKPVHTDTQRAPHG